MRTRPRSPETSIEMFVVRIGNAEREATVDLLTEHHVHGRLDVVELDRRQDAAMTATTQAELTALVADLPPLAATAAPARVRQTRAGRPRVPGALWLVSPAAVGATAWWMAITTNVNSGQVLATGLLCGGMGLVGGWWGARRADDHPSH